MNWQNFQAKGYELTEQEIIELQKEIANQYNTASKEISEAIKTQYAKYLASIGTEDYYSEMLKYNRLKSLQQEVSAIYRQYTSKAELLADNALKISASNSFYRSVYAQSWIVPEMASAQIPYELVELIVYGSASEWKAISKKAREKIEATFGTINEYLPKAGTLTDLLTKNKDAEILKIQQAITSGLQQGLSYTKIVNNLNPIIGQILIDADGELSATGAVANMLRIVQTESARAMNAGSFASTQYLNNMTDSTVKKRWVATLDERTRASHARLDGKTIDVDDYFKIGDDKALHPGGFSQVKNNINCRCVAIDIIDGEGPMLRTGRNPETGESETFDYADFQAWAKTQKLKRNVYGEYYS